MTMRPGKLRKYSELDGKTFLVCAGANKCATSWVFLYLNSLEGVTASPLKEVHFFSPKFVPASSGMDLYAIKRLAYHMKADGDVVANLRERKSFQASLDRVKMIYDDNAYFAHFAGLATQSTKTLCDVTPAYSAIGANGFEYMKDFFNSQDVTLKLLFIMRDPVDRLWSHIRYRAQDDANFDMQQDWRGLIDDPDFLQWSDYRQTVEALDAAFPPENLHYCFFEGLFSEATLKRVCEFVGADYAAPENSEAVNETRLKSELPDDARDRLLELLAPQYEFCRQRFAGLIPPQWRA